jgi:hypothetical protein
MNSFTPVALATESPENNSANTMIISARPHRRNILVPPLVPYSLSKKICRQAEPLNMLSYFHTLNCFPATQQSQTKIPQVASSPAS